MVNAANRVVIGKQFIVLGQDTIGSSVIIPGFSPSLAPPPLTDDSQNILGRGPALQATFADGSATAGSDYQGFGTLSIPESRAAELNSGGGSGPVIAVFAPAVSKNFFEDLSYQPVGSTAPAQYIGSIEVDVLPPGSPNPGVVILGIPPTLGSESLPNVSLRFTGLSDGSLPQIVPVGASPPPPPPVVPPSPPPPIAPSPPPAVVKKDIGPDFNAAYYLATNPDVAAAGVDPATHYDTFGWKEGRNPSPAFNTAFYLAQNPDVKAAGVDPLVHFENNGSKEGRNPNALFNVTFYLAQNPDVKAAGVDPLTHYETFGWKERRDAGTGVAGGFDSLTYLSLNPDVKAASVNPLDHYLTFGLKEGRRIS